jgi:hypothetical protein
MGHKPAVIRITTGYLKTVGEGPGGEFSIVVIRPCLALTLVRSIDETLLPCGLNYGVLSTLGRTGFNLSFLRSEIDYCPREDSSKTTKGNQLGQGDG